ncbi:Thymus-specific serine protease [Perkinsus chesapeaki]|uniref:Thymus-specific serine protease n=1 Tax=Perkinsus chesapeaki TaxID=330153 RepID=A0A7J6LLE1_PERCH|nr:Thymus-specific serine protease [Perkinsus chesapeaki]
MSKAHLCSALHKLVCLLILIGCSGDPSSVFDQVIDHFGGTGTFKQRYLYSDKFVNGKPQLVIVDIRGEGSEVEMGSLGLDVFNAGIKTKSIMVALEHRFYGKSRPLLNPTTKDLLKLLQTSQAVADLVTFREFIIKKYGLSHGVQFVLMGCSYAGSLAAWARVKHPDLFLGAVASCPVIDLRYDSPQYFLRVLGLLRDTNGRYMIQSNDPFCTSALCNIEKKCSFIFGSNTTTDQQALQVFNSIGNYIPRPDRLADYNQYISRLKDKSEVSDVRFNQFQACSQWALFRSCDSSNQCPFIREPRPLEIDQAVCHDAFGLSEDDVRAKLAKEQKDFGGAGLNGTTNILVILGGMDPWNAAGRIGTSTHKGPIQMEVPLGSHCYWARPGATRLDGVKQILSQTLTTIQSWVKGNDPLPPVFI